jgi:hypothetical protein
VRRPAVPNPGRPYVSVLWAAAVFLLMVGQACSNSILGNATEAGLETLLDQPAPTPTAPSAAAYP